MIQKEIFARFDEIGATHADFVRWAAGKGVNVDNTLISKHRNGKRGITPLVALAYLAFLDEIKTA